MTDNSQSSVMPKIPPLVESAARSGLVLSVLVLGFLFLQNFGAAAGFISLFCGAYGIVYLCRRQLAEERTLRKSNSLKTGKAQGYSFISLWSYGIATSFFAAMTVGVVVYCSLKFIWPDFIVSQLETSVELLSGNAEWAPLRSMLEGILEHGPIPGAADIMASVMTMMMLTGTIFAFLGALWAKALAK